ncbi:MAG: hypothetical protein PHC98_02560 [Syntrophotalea acetylenica]|nr:hypothetical protein [Syntrophotalea acetylenica]
MHGISKPTMAENQLPLQDKSEQVLDWLERLDRHGPFMALDRMREFLEMAPLAAKETREYIYLEGLLDGRSVHEELGGI